MNEFTSGITETLRKLKKDKKALLTLAVGIGGMLLILLSEIPVSEASQQKNVSQQAENFSRELEEETEKLISKIKGAGRVSVMLTYESSEERVWAMDKEEKIQSDGESDIDERYIIIDADEGETGLALKVIYPRVRGVAVVCSGGADPAVQSEIKGLLTALFDIGSNRISIAPRAEEE